MQSEERRRSRTRPANREFLLDVSRLVWRRWRGGLPTGIDRVCLAYLDHFAGRADAVVQRGGRYWVLSPGHSDKLFGLLRTKEQPVSRLSLGAFMAGAIIGAWRHVARPGTVYVNVGHTGLQEPTLPSWIARNELRAIFMVHDLIPITHSQFCRPGEAEKHRQRMINMLASAAGIIANSRVTIDDLAAFAASSKRHMPPSVIAWISGSPRARPAQPRTLSTPHFVTVGTIEGRKNHLLLLRLWQRLVSELGQAAPKLVIIGQRGWKAEPALAILDQPGSLTGHVVELGKCSDGEMVEWLAGARALLMPSFAEGFGLPIIEALQLGTPVVATDLPVFREIADDRLTYLAPDDDLGWEKVVKSLAKGGERPDKQPTTRRYSAPDWPSHFAKVEDFLDRL